MATLEWIGKDKIVNHHSEVPYCVLDRKYSFDQSGRHEEDNGSENMIIHGDNLYALKSLLPRYEGKVDCIYIDPPYNTGESGWIYNDRVDDPRIAKWLGSLVNNEDLSRHDKWLCLMYPRLSLLKRLLSNKGVIFISIGDDELGNLINLCESIFGNPTAIFVWKSRSKPTNAGQAKYRAQKVSEYVLMYSLDSDRVYNVGSKEGEYTYPNHDEYGNYRTTTILTSNYGTYSRETMRFEIAGYSPPPEKRWKAGREKIEELLASHRLLIRPDGDPMEKIYEDDDDSMGTPMYTLIDQSISGTAESGKTLLNNIIGKGHGFDTVKPVGLVQYLIGLVTDPDSIVLDSFAGSATTAHAVLNLNHQDGGNRKFILIEMMDYAENITSARVRNVITGYESVKEVEEVLYSKKLTMSNLKEGPNLLKEAQTFYDSLDFDRYAKVSKPTIKDSSIVITAKINKKGGKVAIPGSFSYYELGERLFTDDDVLNEDVPLETIREYIFFTETGQPYVKPDSDIPSYLGSYAGVSYYFIYDSEGTTSLDYDFLSVPDKNGSSVVYADVCLIDQKTLRERNITFRKIPRDIMRL